MASGDRVVGDVFLNVKPLDQGFDPAVQRIINDAERKAKMAVKADTTQAEQAVAGLANQIDNQIGGAWARAGVQAAGFTAAIFAVRAAAEGAINKLAGLFDQLAQAQAGFSSILKSDAAGGRLLDDIREFARVSPFVTQELVNYSQQLLGVGVAAEKIVPLLEDVGNIVSSVGGDTQNIGRVLFTLTQIQSIGRLAGQDAMQLQSALIPITKYLSEYLGKTTAEVKKMQEQGQISSDMVFASIAAAGGKVEGAMANATRNISGARSVLSDTITIMLQDQPVLTKIFEDIYKGIIKFADALGSDEFQQVFSRFFDGVDKIYEGLKPLFESLSEFGGGAGLTILSQLASTLEILGNVIQTIEPVLPVLGQMFAAMALLRAPLMLVEYVRNLSRFTGLMPSVIGQTLGHAKAVDQETAALQRRNNALARLAAMDGGGPAATGGGRLSGLLGNSKVQMGLLGGAGLAATKLSSSDNQSAQMAGAALTYGTMGFMLGGPTGAAVGAAIGAISEYTSQQEERARKHVEEMRKLGREAAESFVKEGGAAFESANSTSFTSLTAESERLQRELVRRQEELNRVQDNDRLDASSRVVESALGWLPGTDWALGDTKEALEQLTEAEGKLALLEEQTAATRSALEGLFEPVTIKMEEIIPLLSQGSAAFDLFTKKVTSPTGNVLTQWDTAETDMVALEAGLKKYGLTLTDIAQRAPEEIKAITNAIDGLDSAQQTALLSAQAWGKAYTEAQAAAAAIVDPGKAQISAQISNLNAIKAAMDANIEAGRDANNEIAQLTAESAALEAKRATIALTTANLASGLSPTLDRDERADAMAKINLQALAAGERAYADAIRYRAQGAALAAVDARNNFIAERAMTDGRIEAFLRLSEVMDTVANRQIVVDVVTRGIQEAIAQIAQLQAWIAQLQSGKTGVPSNIASGEANEAQRQLSEQQRRMGLIAGTIAPKSDQDREYLKSVFGDIASGVAAAAATGGGGGGGGGGGPTLEELMVQAGESLKSSIESAAEAIEQAAEAWKSSIKERTEYEQAVSVGRLTRNANRQATDLAEMQAGMANLRGRGVTDEVLAALGIDSVEDTRQVRKLVNSSDSELAALTKSVTERDALASTIAANEEQAAQRRNITAAIVEAAKILGLDTTESEAVNIINEFSLTATSDGQLIADQILGLLTGSKIG